MALRSWASLLAMRRIPTPAYELRRPCDGFDPSRRRTPPKDTGRVRGREPVRRRKPEV